jgi:hypothetical protein
VTDHINHPRVGGRKLWSERTPPKEKSCQKCTVVFQPFCGANKYCAACVPIAQREKRERASIGWKERNRDRMLLTYSTYHLRVNFGMTMEDYLRMVDAQGGKCVICQEVPVGGRGILRKLAVDHCHTTGRVRGLLCGNCNTALGLFRESPDRMLSAISYLKERS